MTDYAYVGKKGTGKSKHAVITMRDRYFKRGRAVASNLDLDLKAMFGVRSKLSYVRIPDKPSEFDLLSVGHGNPDSYDEEKNGAMVLDELGTWMNTRTFADKSRAGTLDYLAHARKHGWDCFYIMQDIQQVDKQLRESFIEQTVRHIRFDKVRIPFIGSLLSLLFTERAGYMPRFHVATSRLGTNPQDVVCDRLMFTGKDVEACYDTRQVFEAKYQHGAHSVLSPWHIEGRFLEDAQMPAWKKFLRDLWAKPARQKRTPVTAPDEAFARVVGLCRTLPANEALAIMARYTRVRAGADRGPA